MITGIAGEYLLDEHGDRDVVFSLIYTNTNNEVSSKTSSTPTEYTRFIGQGDYGNVGIISETDDREHTWYLSNRSNAINLCYHT